MNEQEASFIARFGDLYQRAHHTSVTHGFWESADKHPVNYKLSRIALMHSELSEALHGIRKGLMDDHLPTRPMEEAEMADTIIRIMDYAAGFGLDVAGAIVEKMRYNEGRPYGHGDKAL
jgi:hypothetical protein